MTMLMIISSSNRAFHQLGVCSFCLGRVGESGCSIWVDLDGWWHKRPMGGKHL